MIIAEETYLYEKVQDSGLNMGGGHGLRKEEMTKVHAMLLAENLPIFQ